jgi:hypothetical protein
VSRPVLLFRSEAHIARPIDAVWELFSDLSRWNVWSPICRKVEVVAGNGLKTGAVIRMHLRICGVGIPVRATIVECSPPRTITWRAKSLGMTATHSYRFTSREAGTSVVNEETFLGLPRRLRDVVSWWYRKRRIGDRSLAGLRRALETDSSERRNLSTVNLLQEDS